MSSVDTKIASFVSLLKQLPLNNAALMHELFTLLAWVSSHSSVNKMSIPAISIVIGPNVLRPKQDSSTPEEFMRMNAAANSAVEFLLTQYVAHFEPLLRQRRLKQ